jgi:hypothetical protein
MKRLLFLQLSTAIVPLAAVPFVVQAQTKSKKRADKGFKVGAGKDRFDDSSLSQYTWANPRKNLYLLKR